MTLKLAFLGFGEAGQHIAAGIKASGHQVEIAAWDILFPDAAKGERLRAAADKNFIRIASGPADAFAGADVILSVVTTDQSIVAAKEAAPHLPKGVLYLDCNSTSPGTKRKVAEIVERAGGHMVESAVMDYVPKHGHKVPMLLSGKHAADVVAKLGPTGMQLENLNGDIGQASTIKMCRSVFMKGLDGILLECLVSADRAGVAERVLASIQATIPQIDWEAFVAAKMAGAAIHSGRRAGEMREVAQTVTELGLDPHMAAATSNRLQWAHDLGLKVEGERDPTKTVRAFLDRVERVTGGKAKAAE